MLPNLTQYSAPLRRFGAWLPARTLVVLVGVIAMTAYTVPELRDAVGFWLRVCLWCCLGFFAADAGLRLRAARAAGGLGQRVWSLSGLVDLLGIVPVPIALACGVPHETAWLFGSLWVLKLGQDSPGFTQIGRVFVLEAKPLASVLTQRAAARPAQDAIGNLAHDLRSQDLRLNWARQTIQQTHCGLAEREIERRGIHPVCVAVYQHDRLAVHLHQQFAQYRHGTG